MTINDAINHAKEKAEDLKGTACGVEHAFLAEQLERLQQENAELHKAEEINASQFQETIIKTNKLEAQCNVMREALIRLKTLYLNVMNETEDEGKEVFKLVDQALSQTAGQEPLDKIKRYEDMFKKCDKIFACELASKELEGEKDARD